jgi:hypothetical protein
LQNITGPSLVGRSGSSGTGSPELIGLAAALTINGSKQLDLAAAVVAAATTVTAGTGLTGGGDLSANRTFTLDFATSGASSTTKAVRADDSRLSDSRTPSAHTHGLTDSYVGHIETATANQTYTSTATSRSVARSRGSDSDQCGHGDSPRSRTARTRSAPRTVSAPRANSVTSGLSNTTVSQNGAITLVVDAVSTPADLWFSIRYTAATGAIS